MKIKTIERIDGIMGFPERKMYDIIAEKEIKAVITMVMSLLWVLI